MTLIVAIDENEVGVWVVLWRSILSCIPGFDSVNDAHIGFDIKSTAYNRFNSLTNFRNIMPALYENENHLHIEKQSGNITNFHLSYFWKKPQQPAHLSVRSRMVSLFKFVAYKPSTPSSSFGVLGFLFAVVS